MLVWGHTVVPLGLHDKACDACGGKIRMVFAYKYAGLFWLGAAWRKQIVGECNECADLNAYVVPEAINEAVSWNYRYGWVLWAALMVWSMAGAPGSA